MTVIVMIVMMIKINHISTFLDAAISGCYVFRFEATMKFQCLQNSAFCFYANILYTMCIWFT